MMLSTTESAFVRILRGTVIATASLAILITVGALLYAAYAYLAPEPHANLYGRLAEFRQATDPINLISEVFPKDSSVVKDLSSIRNDVSYERKAASDRMLFDEMNKFLNAAFGASFEDESKFADWLHGNSDERIQFSWSKRIDDEKAANENNVNYLLRSLLFDYAKRLSVYGATLAKAKKQDLYASSFDRLVAPTGTGQAPYFLVWFFNRLHGQLQAINTQLSQERAQRNELRLTTIPATIVAGSAFGYFIAIIFCFLFISMEASLRKIAEVRRA